MLEDLSVERGRHLWAKSAQAGAGHSLLAHLLDVGLMAEAILEARGDDPIAIVSDELNLSLEEARRLMIVLVALHDIGKATPVFQRKWPAGAPAEALTTRADDIPHGRAGGILLREWLVERGVRRRLATSLANAVAIHHGQRLPQSFASPDTYDPRSIGEDTHPWRVWQAALLTDVEEAFGPLPQLTTKKYLRGRSWALLAGLTSVADWLGSSLPHAGKVADTARYTAQRQEAVRERLAAVGWPLGDAWWREPTTGASFSDWFSTPAVPFQPRPLQAAVEEVMRGASEPTLLLIEAPMGEGKTEAAFFSAVQPIGRSGTYVALPTQATSDAMHDRLTTFVEANRKRNIEVALAHAASRVPPLVAPGGEREAHPEGIESQTEGEAWFSAGRRELLAELGAGTVDQALLAVLPVRHFFVRAWGLAGKVVVFDEVHAYDAYTGGLLAELLRWLAATRSSAVVMSATLPAATRMQLMAAYSEGLGRPAPELEAAPYPRLTLLSGSSVETRSFAASASTTVRLQSAPYDLLELAEELVKAAETGGAVACIVNTVDRAQRLYTICKERATDVTLLHGRFPLSERKRREAAVVQRFGPDGAPETRAGIVVATQVVEQSLDLDFDVLYSDLAPIDLLLQRMGRMHRHAGRTRPTAFEEASLRIAGLESSTHEGPRDEALQTVYAEYLLWRSWAALAGKEQLSLPTDIDALVQLVYSETPLAPLVAFAAQVEAARREFITQNEERSRAAETWSLGAPLASSTESWGEAGRDVDDWREYALKVPTRLGDDTVTAIPLTLAGATVSVYRNGCSASHARGRRPSAEFVAAALGEQIRISRKSLVAALRAEELPAWWRNTGALKHTYPLFIDERGRASIDQAVRLDPELGVVYEKGAPDERT